ncbi:uncharacterized protein EURHEDRAFT_415572 [Aspergillus ruber CBS 135680]|uniref:Uncharacterized protein n=1 Tax=Aspergillus ruber (strain CBS 135680) TaxID=1388766 RepID=A0A017S767_ASPRC|nr:uncharacterized protein EURHEDRAFT_415572 [Aspergillus ruber CBS 135680]EYE92454.1 hypothetical protein EURHEDRAFT_415572 [Aspergillus ruber CBS 135680]
MLPVMFFSFFNTLALVFCLSAGLIPPVNALVLFARLSLFLPQCSTSFVHSYFPRLSLCLVDWAPIT